jgi:hypothetical protein
MPWPNAPAPASARSTNPSDASQRLGEVLTSIFSRGLGDELLGRYPYVPRDLFSIIHGMADAAGKAQEGDDYALARRVERAVLGYVASFEL